MVLEADPWEHIWDHAFCFGGGFSSTRRQGSGKGEGTLPPPTLHLQVHKMGTVPSRVVGMVELKTGLTYSRQHAGHSGGTDHSPILDDGDMWVGEHPQRSQLT